MRCKHPFVDVLYHFLICVYKENSYYVNLIRYMAKKHKTFGIIQWIKINFVFFSHVFINSWMRLGFTVDVKGNVPVKVIARTFASGNF